MTTQFHTTYYQLNIRVSGQMEYKTHFRWISRKLGLHVQTANINIEQFKRKK